MGNNKYPNCGAAEMLERKLSQLFDLQRFQQNPRLNSILQEAASRCAGALADDDLALVSAAGEAHLPLDEDEPLGNTGALMLPEGEKP